MIHIKFLGECSVRMMKRKNLIKALLIAISMTAIGLIVGCTSGFAEPFDISNIYYSYTTVSDSNEKYIIITKHIVSQSDVKIPDTIYGIPVREIGDSVFAEDQLIKSVRFGKNVRRIGSNAFGKCTNLQSITFNVSMSDVGDYAFQECVSLQSVVLPDHLEKLGRGSFYGCQNLSEVSIPQEIKSIGGRAFGETAYLNSLSKETFVTVGDGILIAYNGNQSALKLPKTVKSISEAFAGNTSLEKVTMRSGITAVGDMAFMGCSSLKEINIPSSVTEIGGNAFYGCATVEKLIIPDSVQYIGADAFTGCRAALFVREGSYAEKYCAENKLDCFANK